MRLATVPTRTGGLQKNTPRPTGGGRGLRQLRELRGLMVATGGGDDLKHHRYVLHGLGTRTQALVCFGRKKMLASYKTTCKHIATLKT